jgi:hypothetical protein
LKFSTWHHGFKKSALRQKIWKNADIFGFFIYQHKGVFEMKQKTIFFAMTVILVAQTVFAKPYDKHEIDFLVAFFKSDLAAMEKALQERTSQTNLDVLLQSVIQGYGRSGLSGINENRSFALPTIRLLIKYGADCNNTNHPYIYYGNNPRSFYIGGISAWDTEGDICFSPLHHAIKGELGIPIVKFLLESGANMYPRRFDYELFPYQDEDIAYARVLIENGYNVNRVFSSYSNETQLHRAARNGHIAVVRLLVEAGAKVNQQDGNGKTPAQIAYEAKETDIYNYLKQKDATWSPPSQVATAPPASSRSRQTYDDSYDYSPPPSSSSRSSGSSSSGSSSSSSGSGWADVGKAITESLQSPLESGTYGLAGSNAKVSFTSIGKSGIIMYVTRDNRRGTGSYSINGNTMTVQIEGLTDVYTITSKTSFTGRDGSVWVRTGY